MQNRLCAYGPLHHPRGGPRRGTPSLFALDPARQSAGMKNKGRTRGPGFGIFPPGKLRGQSLDGQRTA